MRALQTLAIYVTPFFIIGIAVMLLMKRKGVESIRCSSAGGTDPQSAQGVSPGCLAQ